MKKIKIILLMIGLNYVLFAIDKVSLELDVLPYLTGGNYIGIGVANNGLNYRLIKANVNLPNFVLQKDIESINMDVSTIIVDYFFDRASYQGLWIGIGYEIWDLEITEKESQIKENLRQRIFTLGGGYVYNFSENFYINPWAAIHYDLNSNTKKLVGNTSYEPNRTTPEASLKFGYNF